MQATETTSGERISRTAWIWPVALAAVIFAASSRPRLVDVDGFWPGADKGVHFAVYGLLAVLICRVGRGTRFALISVLLASAYGASDEWHQSFVPGRTAELADWVADSLGAAVAVGAYVWSARRRRTVELLSPP